MMLGATHTFLFWHLDTLDARSRSTAGVTSNGGDEEVGVSSSSNGLLYAACCIANMLPELAAFAYSGILIEKLGHSMCVALAAVAYSVKLVLHPTPPCL